MAKGKTKPVAPTKTSATSSSTALAPAPSPEGSLSRYLAEIRKFPILEAQEEYELARDYA
ncbi:MAG: sigma-70 factor domain-containing protein, partial [Pseudomonadota bacterium]|nr:sigma-70 factor domain-containing protein [Pseudomonadota bacterium]